MENWKCFDHNSLQLPKRICFGIFSDPDFAWAILNVGLGWEKINPDIGTAFNIVPVEPREDVSDWERVIKMSHLI